MFVSDAVMKKTRKNVSQEDCVGKTLGAVSSCVESLFGLDKKTKEAQQTINLTPTLQWNSVLTRTSKITALEEYVLTL